MKKLRSSGEATKEQGSSTTSGSSGSSPLVASLASHLKKWYGEAVKPRSSDGNIYMNEESVKNG